MPDATRSIQAAVVGATSILTHVPVMFSLCDRHATLSNHQFPAVSGNAALEKPRRAADAMKGGIRTLSSCFGHSTARPRARHP
jgi:hypothetical protein